MQHIHLQGISVRQLSHVFCNCCCCALCRQVIDLISLKPFDMETISKSIKKTRKALIVEECMKTGGIGASLSAVINESLFDELDHQV
jgi:pyruvate dehydrogenase E1 component beta subunit